VYIWYIYILYTVYFLKVSEWSLWHSQIVATKPPTSEA
jgi:hypothetical protein